ncbi:DNA/RNA non-specific endonuclease [Gangjinia marincola]
MRKFLYPLLLVLVTIGLLYVEKYVDHKQNEPNLIEGEKPKFDTKTELLPTSTTGSIIHHNYYSLSYAEDHEQAEWVAYELNKEQLVNNDFKRPYFEIDLAVPTGAAHWRNYKKSGYDRGHLCPAADREFSREAYEETFLTSNISPQLNAFNAGIWNRLEQKVRYWAKSYDGVYVITGGVLENDLEQIGTEGVSVPREFYKILYDVRNGEHTAIAFLFPHQASNEGLYTFVTSIDHIERRTGIDFFSTLPDTIENELEKSSDLKKWSLK